MLAAGLTFWLLQLVVEVRPEQFLTNKMTTGMLELKWKDFVLSLAARAASILMYLSCRRNVIAGPLVALILIPATAAVGMSLVVSEWVYAGEILRRLGMDMAIIIGTGILLIYAKQKLGHKRDPLR